MRLMTLTVLAAASFCMSFAQARISEINVQRVEPFAENATFGKTGAYERVWGVAKGELDPADARNKALTPYNDLLRDRRESLYR